MTPHARCLALRLPALLAMTTATMGAPSNDPFAGEPEPSGISIVSPAAAPAALPTAKPPPSGNPLWAVPVSALAATRERPLFVPSRRPPPRAVAAAPAQAAPVVAEHAPEPLTLILIGAVVGEDGAVAVFTDRSTQGIVRLRLGQAHGGWALTSIEPRAATLTRGAQIENVAMQRGEANVAPPPFVPRATPKNGESDGL